jgi:hypothetical protein
MDSLAPSRSAYAIHQDPQWPVQAASVRRGDHEIAIWLQNPQDLRQDSPPLGDVFDHLTASHLVEGLIGKRQSNGVGKCHRTGQLKPVHDPLRLAQHFEGEINSHPPGYQSA